MRVQTLKDGLSFSTYFRGSQVGTDNDLPLYLLGLVPSELCSMFSGVGTQ